MDSVVYLQSEDPPGMSRNFFFDLRAHKFISSITNVQG